MAPAQIYRASVKKMVLRMKPYQVWPEARLKVSIFLKPTYN
jgi:hypothetical protein